MSTPEKDFPPLPAVEERTTGVEKGVKKPSWVQIAQNGASLSKNVLAVETLDGKEIVEVPDDVIQDSVPLWDDLLEGKFLSTAPHIAKIHAIVNKIWPLGDASIRIDVYEVDTLTVKFRIKDKNVRNRIVKRGMWNIENVPMIVTKWSPKAEEEEEQEIKVIPMWITMKNVPQKNCSGKPKRLHPETILCKSFVEAKVFVEADMTKELPKTHHFKSKLGVDAEVQFEYPWLPHKCKLCSKWGHLAVACGNKKKQLKILQKEKETVVETVVPVTEEVSVQTVENEKQSTPDKGTQARLPNETILGNALTVLARTEEDVLPSDGGRTEKGVTLTQEDDETEDGLQKIAAEEDTWSDVSPSKKGRSTGKSTEFQEVGSPSRFAILNDTLAELEEEETNTHDGNGGDDDSEEGEILEDIRSPTQSQIVTSNENVEGGKEGSQLRRTSTRATKGVNKNLIEFFALSTQEIAPSAAGW
ncbi:hypothetical protein N665_0378s0016 [Sinapis alba]|nr:hypothetical protein N665_0378s0016 [Sinapis alba]